MKLKTLFLGSVAAVGLSTSAYAADLAAVVSSFDVCENLGMSGLTISSSDDCLQISGNVSYTFKWGDYAGGVNPVLINSINFDLGNKTLDVNNGGNDWESEVEWWLQFVGAAQSDFGTAKAVIKLYGDDDYGVVDSAVTTTGDGNNATIKEAYVSIGDTTKIIAGRRDSSVFLGAGNDDTPFGYLGLFGTSAVDTGVDVLDGLNVVNTKGHVIQLYHTVGDTGLTLSAGLEDLNNAGVSAGSAIGTVAYASDNLTGHVSVGAGGILDGTISSWKIHAGGTGTFDNFKVRGAFAYGRDDVTAVDAFHGMVGAQASFDMFTLAADMEYLTRTAQPNQWGADLSAAAAVTDEVTVKAGFRYFDADTGLANTESWQAGMALIAKLTETLTATGEVGYYGTNNGLVPTADGVVYGSAELAWAPGGQFTSSIKGEVNSLGAYKATFKASKTFD